MSAQHTPGPWRYMSGTRGIYAGERKSICTLHGPRGAMTDADRDANARLIAAAPDLLAALQLIAGTDPVDAALDPQRAVRVARAAIAKATGSAA